MSKFKLVETLYRDRNDTVSIQGFAVVGKDKLKEIKRNLKDYYAAYPERPITVEVDKLQFFFEGIVDIFDYDYVESTLTKKELDNVVNLLGVEYSCINILGVHDAMLEELEKMTEELYHAVTYDQPNDFNL